MMKVKEEGSRITAAFGTEGCQRTHVCTSVLKSNLKERAAVTCLADLLPAQRHLALARPKEQEQGWKKQPWWDKHTWLEYAPPGPHV